MQIRNALLLGILAIGLWAPTASAGNGTLFPLRGQLYDQLDEQDFPAIRQYVLADDNVRRLCANGRCDVLGAWADVYKDDVGRPTRMAVATLQEYTRNRSYFVEINAATGAFTMREMSGHPEPTQAERDHARDILLQDAEIGAEVKKFHASVVGGFQFADLMPTYDCASHRCSTWNIWDPTLNVFLRRVIVDLSDNRIVDRDYQAPR